MIHARGVFWRRLLGFAALNTPFWIEPAIMAFWAAAFLFWRSGRRGLTSNLRAIFPRSPAPMNLLRAYRVLWNFAWTIADTMRFKELRLSPDWEFDGWEHFESLQAREGGAIILTAHMGSYDLGAHLFAEISHRRIVMVRAPERDEETRAFEDAINARTAAEGLRIDFSTRASELALDLLHALHAGEIIAIQGDRVTPGITALPATLFGRRAAVPAGPFALAMAARVPIYPLFITRVGRRRYRLVTGRPFEVQRTRDRGEAFERAVGEWTHELERVVRDSWWQWFAFEPYIEERAA